MSQQSQTTILESLLESKCESLTKGCKPLIIPTIESNLSALAGWQTPLNYAYIERTFQFKNYHQTVAFVNAVTWLAHKEDHHPQISFGYNQCVITLSTHVAKGLTMNDMILAAKINALLD